MSTRSCTKGRRTGIVASDLRRALLHHELELHYQPIVDLGDGVVVGLEALVRWPHRHLGLLDAGAFVPLAERAGLVRALDDWVISAACRQLGEWQDDVLVGPGFRIAVNVSGVELNEDSLAERVVAALEHAGARAHGLTVEVTETSAIASVEAARRSFERLHELGVELALDDFGCQHANFARLHALPFDVLKIDRDFVVASASPTGRAFVQALVELGGHLDARLLAEGIETATQAAQMRTLGCHEGQGYHWARALPAADAARLLGGAPRWPLPNAHVADAHHRSAAIRTAAIAQCDVGVTSPGEALAPRSRSAGALPCAS